MKSELVQNTEVRFLIQSCLKTWTTLIIWWVCQVTCIFKIHSSSHWISLSSLLIISFLIKVPSYLFIKVAPLKFYQFLILSLQEENTCSRWIANFTASGNVYPTNRFSKFVLNFKQIHLANYDKYILQIMTNIIRGNVYPTNRYYNGNVCFKFWTNTFCKLWQIHGHYRGSGNVYPTNKLPLSRQWK